MNPATHIQYNRNRRQWQVFDRQGNHLGTAPDGTSAQWLQLKIERPDVHRLARLIANRHPEMASRALRAGLIVLTHKAMPAPDGAPDTYRVFSQRGNGYEYRVHIPPGDRTAWTCTLDQTYPYRRDPNDAWHQFTYAYSPARPGTCCPDIANGAPHLTNGKRCKHMTAAWILANLDRHPPPAQKESPAAATAEPSATDTSAPVSPDYTADPIPPPTRADWRFHPDSGDFEQYTDELLEADARRAQALPYDYPRGRSKLFKS